jgi:hypothetical protein
MLALKLKTETEKEATYARKVTPGVSGTDIRHEGMTLL